MPPKRKLDESNLQAAKRQRIHLTDHDVDFKKNFIEKCKKLNNEHVEFGKKSHPIDGKLVLSLVFHHGVQPNDYPPNWRRRLIKHFMDKAILLDEEYDQWTKDYQEQGFEMDSDEMFARIGLYTSCYQRIGFDREQEKSRLFGYWKASICKEWIPL